MHLIQLQSDSVVLTGMPTITGTKKNGDRESHLLCNKKTPDKILSPCSYQRKESQLDYHMLEKVFRKKKLGIIYPLYYTTKNLSEFHG